jgi:uncharacterized protein involved in response to NO
LWLAGRLAMLFPGAVAAGVDSLFLIVFAAWAWREVLGGRNWRNVPVCVLVSLFAAANVAFHLISGGGLGAGERAALSVAAGLIALIGGRIIPSFTRNWLRARGVAAQPPEPGRIDRLALGLTGLAGVLWTAFPDHPLAGAALAAAGAANLLRLARWRGGRTLKEPLVTVLHVGYFWLGLGLALLGASVLTPLAPRTAGVHALTAGAIGVMTLAVMTRVSRGHTGRPLTADRPTVLIYLAINLAAVTRVAAPFCLSAQTALLAASAVLWVLAYGGYAAAYAPMLLRPRVSAG